MKLITILTASVLSVSSFLAATPARAGVDDGCYRHSDGHRYWTEYDRYGRPHYTRCKDESTLETAAKLGIVLIGVGILSEVLGEDETVPEYRTHRRQPVYYPSRYPSGRRGHDCDYVDRHGHCYDRIGH